MQFEDLLDELFEQAEQTGRDGREGGFVLAVPHLAQIALRHPVPTVLSERFHVEVRPPNDTELEDDLRKPAPTSSVGLPFAGPDLIAYRRNELRVEVTEYMRLDIVNRAAARAIRIRR
jgi:hypothetical protein